MSKPTTKYEFAAAAVIAGAITFGLDYTRAIDYWFFDTKNPEHDQILSDYGVDQKIHGHHHLANAWPFIDEFKNMLNAYCEKDIESYWRATAVVSNIMAELQPTQPKRQAVSDIINQEAYVAFEIRDFSNLKLLLAGAVRSKHRGVYSALRRFGGPYCQ